MTEQAITFFLVRHGESECNVKFIPDCLPNEGEYPLTNKGQKQIQKIAKLLAKEKVDAIVSSPIQRTRETAEILAIALGVPIVLDERLQEMNFGVFKGKSMKAFWKKYPDPKMRISPDPEDHIESFIEMRGRLKSFLDSLKEKYVGKNLIIVSHSDPLEQLHGILVNESPGASSVGWHPDRGEHLKIEWKL